MDPASYIQIGDEVHVMWTSTELEGFSGRVIDIGPGEYGRRDYIIQKSGSDFGHDAPIGVPESKAVISVRRGDCMVDLPLPLLIEDAEEKEKRRLVNERKRIEKKVPLFADQISIPEVDSQRWVSNFYEDACERLEQLHAGAMRSTDLRSQVEALCSPDDFEYLCGRRNRTFPQTSTYGIQFWTKQLEHIKKHGCIERLVFPPALDKRLKLPWLKTDARLTWKTRPEGPATVRVLFIGQETVMCQIPDDLRKQTFWLKPEDFAEHEAHQ